MHAEKNKGADQYVHLTADQRFCFSLNQTTRFTVSHDVTFTMPRILKYIKITLHLQLTFNACAVIVLLLCFRLLQY